MINIMMFGSKRSRAGGKRRATISEKLICIHIPGAVRGDLVDASPGIFFLDNMRYFSYNADEDMKDR